MRAASNFVIVTVAVCLLLASGCAVGRGQLAGYGCKRPSCVVDPRGVPVEPCCECAPCSPTCCDTDARRQCRRSRETFFDSLYALVCECNCWPNGHCCP